MVFWGKIRLVCGGLSPRRARSVSLGRYEEEMGDQTEAPWTASVTRVDPQAHVYLGNLHQDDRITPYTRDTRGRWSRATTSGEPADSRLNALFEWLVEEAERRGARELHGRYLVEGPELVDPDSKTAS
jgi:hypothetical protein